MSYLNPTHRISTHCVMKLYIGLAQHGVGNKRPLKKLDQCQQKTLWYYFFLGALPSVYERKPNKKEIMHEP